MITIFSVLQIIFYLAVTTVLFKIGYDLSCLLSALTQKINWELSQNQMWDKQEELTGSSTLQDVYHD
tara:strand:+ start:340 stop:540 length:201 start_codon:yes stop_codon:yes gene_type:complete